MTGDRAIKESVQQLAGTHLKDDVRFVDCTVDSVDMSAGTCKATPIGENAPVQITNIQLEANIADGLLIIPVVGSVISVIYSTRNSPYIYKYSDIDTIYYNGNQWQFGDGSYGGLVKVQELYNAINRLETMFNTHTHSVSGSLTGVPVTPITPPTNLTDLENTKVTHGLQ